MSNGDEQAFPRLDGLEGCKFDTYGPDDFDAHTSGGLTKREYFEAEPAAQQPPTVKF